MKLKAFVKAIGNAAETMLVLWSVGVCVGAGLRDGAKMSDFRDECFFNAVKSHRIRHCQRKLTKLGKKEQLTEDEKKQQNDLLSEVMGWNMFNAREEAVLGTKIVGGFDIYHKNKEKMV